MQLTMRYVITLGTSLWACGCPQPFELAPVKCATGRMRNPCLYATCGSHCHEGVAEALATGEPFT